MFLLIKRLRKTIVQALAPCLPAGCRAVTGLVPRALSMAVYVEPGDYTDLSVVELEGRG